MKKDIIYPDLGYKEVFDMISTLRGKPTKKLLQLKTNLRVTWEDDYYLVPFIQRMSVDVVNFNSETVNEFYQKIIKEVYSFMLYGNVNYLIAYSQDKEDFEKLILKDKNQKSEKERLLII